MAKIRCPESLKNRRAGRLGARALAALRAGLSAMPRMLRLGGLAAILLAGGV